MAFKLKIVYLDYTLVFLGHRKTISVHAACIEKKVQRKFGIFENASDSELDYPVSLSLYISMYVYEKIKNRYAQSLIAIFYLKLFD